MPNPLDDVLKFAANAVLDRVFGSTAAPGPAPDPPPPGVIDVQAVEVRPGTIGAGLVDCEHRLARIHELMRQNDPRVEAEIALHAEWVVRYLYNNVLHDDAPAGTEHEIRAVRRRKKGRKA